ncbi:hypothetical protein PAESOLCIP111_06305 [Paenibacillus solanacearum]|uniref:Extracellular solute-binding protein n=1 Tax=Paenibacillus solanacearum TaxID=2048548 RepID=A0A916NYW5_9BACL|nr:extracellular solute-binding protein [Paenibacillus solanacearum]CAG7651386.1 hypothetical protein PAESOLCIP111_06305 [Paenibacillus solanacearum]
MVGKRGKSPFFWPAAAAALLLLGACNGAKPGNGTADADRDAQVTEAGVLPITRQKTMLRVMVRGSGNVENFATNEFTKWLEEKTNIQIEWEVAPEQTYQEKLNVTLASGDYPDVLLNMGISPNKQSIYGKDGVFVPLNDYIEKYGVETKKMYAQVPYAQELMTLPDGNVYALPQINECYHCAYGQKMWINQAWLDELGLPMPVTTEQFYETLKAFKKRDPNGNGKADEIPLAGAINGPSASFEHFIMGAFIEKDNSLKYIRDGRIQVAYSQPEWKEGLHYLNRLYEVGLIAAQSFTQDRNQLKQLGTSPGFEVLGAVPAQNPTVFLEPDSPRMKQYVALPPLRGTEGVRSTAYNPYAMAYGTYVVTNNARNPAAAFRLGDFLLSEEATMRSTIGRPGLEWDKASPGELGLDGRQAKWKQLVTFGKLQNVHWAQYGPSLRTNAYRLSQYADPKYPLEIMLYNETQHKYEPYRMDPSKSVPPLFFTSEQAEELTHIEKAITDYRTEFFAKAVTGAIEIESEWPHYLSALDKLGLDRVLALYQQAYDASRWKK